jgi:hypothetical protein
LVVSCFVAGRSLATSAFEGADAHKTIRRIYFCTNDTEPEFTHNVSPATALEQFRARHTLSVVNEAWFQRAAERAPAILLPFERISEAHALVCGAIGTPWLEEQDRLTADATTNIGASHPLFRDLNTTTDTAIVAVCELAHYLRAFQTDPSLPSVLQDLRCPKFDPVFLELAFAYRWQDAGAAVLLRPATPTGEADFNAVVDGMPFTVEVSSFPHDYFGGVRFRITSVVADTVKDTIGGGTPVAVRVTIHDTSGNLEANVRQAVKDAARAYRAPNAEEARIDAASCSVLISMLTEADP